MHALDEGLSVRAIPVAANLMEPSMAMITPEVIREGEDQIIPWIIRSAKAHKRFASRLQNDPIFKTLPKMPKTEQAMWDKVRLVRDLAALWDYKRILTEEIS